MKTTVHFVKAPHPATYLANKAPIGRALYRCASWLCVSDTQVSNAVVVYHKGRIVAVFKYRMRRNILHGCGTVVEHQHRKKGLGTKLWEAAIKKHKPKAIDVPVSTVGGMKLVKKIRSSHPEISFVIHNWIS